MLRLIDWLGRRWVLFRFELYFQVPYQHTQPYYFPVSQIDRVENLLWPRLHHLQLEDELLLVLIKQLILPWACLANVDLVRLVNYVLVLVVVIAEEAEFLGLLELVRIDHELLVVQPLLELLHDELPTVLRLRPNVHNVINDHILL